MRRMNRALLHNSLNVLSLSYLVDRCYSHPHSGILRSVTNELFSQKVMATWHLVYAQNRIMEQFATCLSQVELY